MLPDCVLDPAYCLVVGAAWWRLLPRSQASPPWLPSWLRAPDGRQAPGGNWTAWTAFVQHCLLSDVGFCQVVGAACLSVLGSAWLWALLGGGCCLGLRLPLPDGCCPAGFPCQHLFLSSSSALGPLPFWCFWLLLPSGPS